MTEHISIPTMKIGTSEITVDEVLFLPRASNRSIKKQFNLLCLEYGKYPHRLMVLELGLKRTSLRYYERLDMGTVAGIVQMCNLVHRQQKGSLKVLSEHKILKPEF